MLAANRVAQDRITKLGRAVALSHAHTEKEEQKRIERLAKERLKALKADDEEAYMKLIDTAKDTRITHLLRQTDAYLDSLAHAVLAQQKAGGGPGIEQEEGEETFRSARRSAVAHRIKEKVPRQPSRARTRFHWAIRLSLHFYLFIALCCSLLR